jgi:hypothetical protein
MFVGEQVVAAQPVSMNRHNVLAIGEAPPDCPPPWPSPPPTHETQPANSTTSRQRTGSPPNRRSPDG